MTQEEETELRELILKDAELRRSKSAACAGKFGFACRIDALKIAKRRNRGQFGRFVKPKPYQCIHCGKWHLGSWREPADQVTRLKTLYDTE